MIAPTSHPGRQRAERAKQLAQVLPLGDGRAGFCLWPVGPLGKTGPLPLEDLPGCFKGRFASTLAGCTRKPRTVLLSPGEKRVGVVLSQGPWP